MKAEQIKTPYDEEIAELEEIKDFAISKAELQHPEGLRDYSYLAEGYRQGVAATEARYKELVAAAKGLMAAKWISQWREDRLRLPVALERLEAALAEVKGAEQ